jgi:hypothetical protein
MRNALLHLRQARGERAKANHVLPPLIENVQPATTTTRFALEIYRLAAIVVHKRVASFPPADAACQAGNRLLLRCMEIAANASGTRSIR